MRHRGRRGCPPTLAYHLDAAVASLGGSCRRPGGGRAGAAPMALRARRQRQSVAHLGADGELARAVAAMDVALPGQPAQVPPELPPPILAHALCYLQCPRALSRARLVSRQWCEVASSDELWRAVYFALAGRPPRPGGPAPTSDVEGGWRRRAVLAWRLGQPHAVSIRPVWGGLDGRLFGAPRSGHAAAVYRPRVDSPEQCLLVGGATTNYAYRRDADVFLPAGGDETEAENCLRRLAAPPIDATNVLSAWSPRWLHAAVVVRLTSSGSSSIGLQPERDTPRAAEGGDRGGGRTDTSAPQRRTAVLLLIGGQQQQHTHAEVHRLELSTAGTSQRTRVIVLYAVLCVLKRTGRLLAARGVAQAKPRLREVCYCLSQSASHLNDGMTLIEQATMSGAGRATRPLSTTKTRHAIAAAALSSTLDFVDWLLSGVVLMTCECVGCDAGDPVWWAASRHGRALR